MIGNDIIDLKTAPEISDRHLKKYYSSAEISIFCVEDYWTILSLKESAWKCLHKLTGLSSFIPPHFTVSPSFDSVVHASFVLPVILLEKNEDYVHAIVGTRGVTGWQVCRENEHREAFEKEYFKRTGSWPTLVKVPSSKSPNGMSAPVLINDPRTSVTFSHDGKFSAYAYKTV